MVQSHLVSKRSSQITNLILPNFPDVDQSHVPVILRARESNTVYTLPNSEIVVPCSIEEVAVVRIIESRRLAKLTSNKMPEIGWNLAYLRVVVQTACESLSVCV